MTRPLTKKDKDGNLYTWPLKIEKAIDAAMEQETAALQERAQLADEKSPDYLPTECLVHTPASAPNSSASPTSKAPFRLEPGMTPAGLCERFRSSRDRF
jgi:hypothetical protein